VSNRNSASPRVPAILEDPIRNRGVAFLPEERDALGLTGRLPPAVLTLDEQSQRAYTQLESQAANTRKVFLELLHDRNATLYFKVLSDHLAELLPLIAGRAADEAIGQYEYGHPRGIYLSIDRPGDIEKSFATLGLAADDVDVIVCSDAEQVPGIGDFGGGGLRVAMATLATYTAAAGIHPGRVIPVSLDTGTDNETWLSDPFYLGNRHARRRGPDYDAFIKRYVQAVSGQFPGSLLHFAGFSTANAREILQAYGHGYRVFSDVQGAGAAVGGPGGGLRPWSGAWLVAQRVGEFVAPGDAEFLVGPLEVAFHGPDRHMQVTGDLLVRAARGRLHRSVQLGGCQPHPGADGPDGRGDGPLAARQQPRRLLLGRGRGAGVSRAAQ
jgi:malate dehydrogenase (oxaloacetate-decarboxylating)